MKNTLFAFCAVAVLALVSCSDEQAPTTTVEDNAVEKTVAVAPVETPQPRTSQEKFLRKSPLVVLNGTVCDIGTVNDLHAVPVSFELRNDGDRPFPLDDVIVNCSCTVLDEIPEDFAIQPGETYTLNAKINAWAVGYGKFERGIEINTKFCPPTEMKIVGNVYPVISYTPGAMNFGWHASMKDDLQTEFDIEGINEFAGILEIAPLENEYFNVSMEKVAPGKFHVKLAGKGIMPPGIFRNSVHFAIIAPEAEVGYNYVMKGAGLFGTDLVFSDTKVKLDRMKIDPETGRYEIYICIGVPDDEQKQFFAEKTLKNQMRRVDKVNEKFKGKGGSGRMANLIGDEAVADAEDVQFSGDDKYNPDELFTFWAELYEDLDIKLVKSEQEKLFTVEKMPAKNGIVLKFSVDPSFVDKENGMFRCANFNLFCHGKKLETIRITSGKLNVENVQENSETETNE